MAESNSAARGVGFPGLLTIVLITLKLLHKIEISWWVAFSPIWISILLFVFVCVVVAVIAARKQP